MVGNSPSILPTQSGTHSLILIDDFQAGCSRDTFNVDIVIIPLPVLNLPPVEEICPGMEIDYVLPGNGVYEWDPMTGVESGAANGEFILSPTITTTYTVPFVDDNSCSTFDTLHVEVFACIDCPPSLEACEIGELEAYSTLTEFLDAGGAANYPCEILENSLDLISEISDGESCPEQITRTYRIVDECGNFNSCEQVITLNDLIIPEMNCSDTLVGICHIDDYPPYSSFNEFELAGGSATDNCQIAEFSFDLISEQSNNLECPESLERIYNVSDACGNSDSCTQIITIHDLENPIINCPTTVPELCHFSDYPSYTNLNEFLSDGGTVFDNCGLDSLSFN